jgi:hypothetical protein
MDYVDQMLILFTGLTFLWGVAGVAAVSWIAGWKKLNDLCLTILLAGTVACVLHFLGALIYNRWRFVLCLDC